MAMVKVSTEFQVAIPKKVRQQMGLQAGRRFQVLRYQNRIELIPIGPIRKLRGFPKGIDTNIKRDEDET